MATGRVNVGGGGGVKKLYRLFTQMTEPSFPRKGDIWIKNASTVSKFNMSIRDSSEVILPIDGMVHIQFMHVLQEFNFREISLMIDGAFNNKDFVYDISSMTIKELKDQFVPLFQKDEVKQYAILVSVKQYRSLTSEWVYLDSLYYDGVKWVAMNYKFYLQLFNSQLLKITKDWEITKTIQYAPVDGELFKVDAKGNYWTQYHGGTNNINFTIKKYSPDGVLLLSFIVRSSIGATATAFHVDDFENVYTIRQQQAISGNLNNFFNETARYIDIYNNGVWTGQIDLGLNNAIGPKMRLDTKDKVYMVGYDGRLNCDLIIDLNSLTFQLKAADRTQAKSNFLVKDGVISYLEDNSTSATVVIDIVTRNLATFDLISRVSVNNAQTIIKGKSNMAVTMFIKKYGNDFVVLATHDALLSMNRFTVTPVTNAVTSVYMNQLSIPTNMTAPPSHRSSKSDCIVIDDTYYVVSRNLVRSINAINGSVIVEKKISDVSSLILDNQESESNSRFQFGIG